MKNVKDSLLSAGLFALVLLAVTSNTLAQVKPSAYAYTNSASAGTNFGTAVTLGTVTSATSIQKSYIQLDLSSIPAGFNGSNIAKATLKLYVNSVTTAGSFNVDYVTGPWAEKTITANLSPSLGTTVAGNVPLTSALVHDYVLVDVTPAVVAWLNGTQANDGLALVANSPLNATFDSKENITNSHAPELDIVFTGGLSGATLTTGGGLAGGVSGGVLNVGMLRTCSTKQVLQWNGTAWACSSAGAGTVSSVGLSAPVSDFTVTGSPVTSIGTLGLNWTVPPSNASTANAIVKRDATGSFNVNSINGTGTIAVVTTATSAIVASTSFDGGFAVHGSSQSVAGTQLSTGVLGDNISPGQFSSGVVGEDINTTGSVTTGVQGSSQSPIGIGVLGFNSTPSAEFLRLSGNQRVGVWGDAASPGGFAIGIAGTSDNGVGVYASVNTGTNVALLARGGTGAAGTATNGSSAISATGGDAGCCDGGGNSGIAGNGIVAAGGRGKSTLAGGPGAGGVFIGGTSLNCSGIGCSADGIRGFAGTGPGGAIAGYSGNFTGDLVVTGIIMAGVKDFKIDHPLDPANKYLVHSSVESSEMMNIYTGNVTTDAQGEATVELPEWFEALNRDFRYQLTVIGQFAQAIVAREMQDHQFQIKTNAPNVKVSWQVTGVRQDAFAKAHPLVVEEKKESRLQGFYIHPELYGAPEEKQIEWARHPQMMKEMKERREKPTPAARP